MMTRRRLLQQGFTGCAAAFYPAIFEPRWLEVTHTAPALSPEPEKKIRILHLSDFHASWAVPMSMIKESIATGLKESPDLICLTGDFITHAFDFDAHAYATALRKLSAAHPTFAVLGNHDGGSWAKARKGYSDHSVIERVLEDSGITLLHNRSLTVQVRDRRLTLVGVGDLWAEELDADKAFQGMRRDGPVVLMSHNPDSKEKLGSFDWDLMLSGHTHGGQIMIPFVGPRYAPVRDKRFVAGLHPWDGRQIYVSRGVGNIGSVRFRCRPEVTLLDI